MKTNNNLAVVLILGGIIVFLILNTIGLIAEIATLTKKYEMRLQVFPVSGGTELNNMPEEIQDANLVH
jgi:hypothetical protein